MTQFAVEAVLFDVDGTLVDSTPAVERAWRTLASESGIDGEAILAVSHGRRSTDTIADFWPQEEWADADVRLHEIEMADLDSVVALPGVAELLAPLPRQRWAAVTSGPRTLMTARLKAAGLPVPEILVTAEDVELGKPHPEGYLLAARRLGYDPARCLVVEDAPPGIAAGLASGASVLGVATSHDAGRLTDAHAVLADLTACAIDVQPDGLVVRTLKEAEPRS